MTVREGASSKVVTDCHSITSKEGHIMYEYIDVSLININYLINGFILYAPSRNSRATVSTCPELRPRPS